MNQSYYFNSKPLYRVPFTELPVGAIKPEGWLYKELQLQADGLTGFLDEIWEDVGPNSGWLGGTGENWERGPYYCDGLVPLAYILNDSHLIEKSKKWIEWSLKSQRDDGFFGPNEKADWWPRMVMLKAMISYYEATEDDRIIPFMLKYFKYQKSKIMDEPLQLWAKARGAENLISIYWLYNRTGEKFLLDLAEIIINQSIDWNKICRDFPYKKPTGSYFDYNYFSKYAWEGILNPTELSKEEAVRLFYLFHTTHVVNVAMGIKFPAICFELKKSLEFEENVINGIEQLEKHHGIVTGMFTGDEHLNGNNPNQGTELCAVVEYMYSLEKIIKVYANPAFADILEKVAYNALPATISSDFWSHQYDQQANQIRCSIGRRDWYNNLDDSNIFGLEPNFGCCTANMHQGWPKLVSHMWYASIDGGLIAVVYGPCTVNTEVKNTKIRIVEETNYPFNGKIKLTISLDRDTEFPLQFRIPGWAKNTEIKVNNENIKDIECNSFKTLNREWKDGDTITINFDMNLKISRWFNNSIGVERGPLVFALKIDEEWRKIRGLEPYADYEVIPKSPWNYGIILDENNLNNCFNIMENGISAYPFNFQNPPVVIKTKGKRIPGWIEVNNSAGELPKSPIESNEPIDEIELIPYGCARLRISQFPELK